MTREDDIRHGDRAPGTAVNETEETINQPPIDIVDVDLEAHEGRFSEGQEEDPDTPEKDVERRFSEGQERHPYSD
jgi:hypothetical protein